MVLHCAPVYLLGCNNIAFPDHQSFFSLSRAFCNILLLKLNWIVTIVNVCPKYAQDMHKIRPKYIQDMPKMCQRYARERCSQDMPRKCPRYAQDKPKICRRYAEDMPKTCPRHAQDIPKICPRYARDMTGARSRFGGAPFFMFGHPDYRPEGGAVGRKVLRRKWIWETFWQGLLYKRTSNFLWLLFRSIGLATGLIEGKEFMFMFNVLGKVSRIKVAVLLDFVQITSPPPSLDNFYLFF